MPRLLGMAVRFPARSSQDPEAVAAFYAENGPLVVSDGEVE